MGDIFGGYSFGDIISNPLGPGLGKPSSEQREAQTQALQNANFLPMALWGATDPFRQNVTKQLTDFTQGNYDLSQSPMFGSGKLNIEDTYSTAKNNLMETLPGGGTLFGQLGELEQSRAKSLTDLYGEIAQDMFNKAYGAGYGTPQASISGANQGANTATQQLLSQQAAANQNAAGLGELIGLFATK